MRILSNLTFTWRAGSSDEQIGQLTELLDRLSELPGIERIDYGPSLGLAPIARDYGVSILFSDEPSFRRYLSDPAHRRFAELGQSLAADTAIVQIAPR
jgi:hypothetical protein